MAVTAQLSSADTDSSKNLCLITDTDLTQLDSCLKHGRQILHQFTEVNSSVSGKVKQYFIIIKGIFRINQLHLKTMLPDLFKTNLKCFFFFLLIVGFLLIITLGSNTQYRLQRLDYLIRRNLPRTSNHSTIFNAPCCFHNNMIVTGNL